MSDCAILERLQDIVRDLLGRPDLVLRRQSVAADYPGWDSVRQVEIILAVEAHFEIRLRAREIDRLRCVGDFLDLIAARAAAP